jgi:hypothetical protein
MKNTISSLAVFAAALLFPVLLIGTIVQYQILTPEAVKIFVERSQLSEAVPGLILKQVFDSPEAAQDEVQDQQDNGFEGDNREEGRAVPSPQELAEIQAQIARALPAERVDAILNQTIDGAFEWWKSDKPVEEFPVMLDISAFKEQIQPMLQETEGLELNPDGSLPDELNLSAFLRAQAEKEPERYAEYNDRVEQWRESVEAAKRWMVIGWIVLSVLVLSIATLHWRSIQESALWIGIVSGVMFIESLGMLMFAMILPTAAGSALPASATPEIARTTTLLIEQLSKEFWQTFAWVAVVLLIITVLALTIHFRLPHNATPGQSRPINTKKRSLAKKK